MKRYSLLSQICVFAGIFFLILGGGLYFQQFIPRNLIVSAFTTEPEMISLNNSPTVPVKFSIDGLGVELPIFESRIQNGIWETSSLGVSSLSNPEEAGASGGLVLYGHNWSSILGKLSQVAVGDKMRVTFADGRGENYSIHSVNRVDPSDVSLFGSANDSTLIVYTCIGLFDSERLVVMAQKESF